jgi:hypothetical protein
MLDLTSAGRPIYLSPGTSIQLERHSPLFDEAVLRGSYSYSFTVPAGPNGPVYGFPERPDSATPPGAALPALLQDDGQALVEGAQRVRAASAKSYSVSLADGLSAVATALSGRALSSFALGGRRTLPRYVRRPYQGEVYLIPALWEHAQAILEEPRAYDYVFAPVRNDDFRDDGAARKDTDPPRPALTVNAYYPGDVTLFAGGHFRLHRYDGTIYAESGTYVDPMGSMAQADCPCCPWPYLRFVLRSVLTEVGLEIDDPHFLPGEWGELVLVSNAELVDRGDADTVAFELADVVPALTVGELLARLRVSFGLVVLLDADTGRVRTAFAADRLASDDAQDLTDFLAGTPEISIEAVAGITLATHGDSGDALTSNLPGAVPGEAEQGAAVDAVAELPLVGPLLPAELRPRLVRTLDAFYQATVTYTPADAQAGTPARTDVAWTYLCDNLRAIDVAGGGEVLEQGHCHTPTRFTEYGLTTPIPGNDPTGVTLPAMAQPGFRADNAEGGARSAELRLLFYQGLRPVRAGTSAWTSPQLGLTSASGALSLLLDGSTGTYETWLRPWLPVKRRGEVLKQALRLSAAQLARLDLTRRVRLGGVEYLMRKLTASVPLRTPVVAELVRV